MKQMPQKDIRNDLRKLSELLKALADETRLTILAMLRDGEMCVCEIMDVLPFSQPAVSHHLKILRQAGLITDKRDGKWIYYYLDPEAIRAAGELLQELISLPARHMSAEQVLTKKHPRCTDDLGHGQ